MKPAENQEKYLYNSGALISMIILWYCAVSGSGTPEAIYSVSGVFVFSTLASLVRKLSKYKNGTSFIDELKSLSFNRDGVSIEMKGGEVNEGFEQAAPMGETESK